jgi:hypothetical protein
VTAVTRLLQTKIAYVAFARTAKIAVPVISLFVKTVIVTQQTQTDVLPVDSVMIAAAAPTAIAVMKNMIAIICVTIAVTVLTIVLAPDVIVVM